MICKTNLFEEIAEMVKTAVETALKEKIVCCKECKFRSHEDGEWHSCLLRGGIKLPESHFCSDGDRRE